jgi:uncharacterized protein
MTEAESAALRYAREFFKGDASGHDFSHTERVYRTALRLAEEERADRETVALAALLHDVDDRKISPETAESKKNAAAFLKSHGVDDKKAAQVLEIIGDISFSGGRVPGTIEGKCVQDADRLDAVGAVGIARTFAFGGSRGRAIYDEDNIAECSIGHFYDKLLKLKDLMNTESARAIAQERDSFMRAFLDEFFDEWNGNN